MALEFSRSTRNMLAIGSTISVGAFGFSLASSKWSITKVHKLDYGKDLKIELANIKNVNDIEDFEQSKGCKFLFYKESGSANTFQNGDFSFARNTSFIDVVDKVKKTGTNCQKGSFVFISDKDTTTVQQLSR